MLVGDFTITAESSKEPVSVELAKKYLREPDSDQDAVIASLIRSARGQAESYTWRQFMPATYSLFLDHFPHDSRDTFFPLQPIIYTRSREFYRCDHTGVISIPRPPLQQINFVKYIDEAGEQQTLDESLYTVDTTKEPGRVAPAPGTHWPLTQHGHMNAVEISYDAGYADAQSVPENVKSFIMAWVTWYYENRDNAKPFPEHITGLLDSLIYGGTA